MGNHNPSLEVASSFSLVHHSKWSASPSVEEERGIVQLVPHLGALKLMDITAADVVASFLRRCIQPLQQRENLGFEYTGLEDPSRMSLLEFSDEQLMEYLRRILPSRKEFPKSHIEFCAANHPPAVIVLVTVLDRFLA